MASAVRRANPSYLKEIDLSYNHLGESGVKLVSEALEEGQYELAKLRYEKMSQMNIILMILMRNN